MIWRNCFFRLPLPRLLPGDFSIYLGVDFNDKPSSIRYNTNQSVLFYSLQSKKADIYAWIDGEESMEKKRGINSFTLHILAMLFMLCDHLWATLFPAQEWLTCIGRLAFPIFAFMIAEGCYYTSNMKKYMQRLFLFAVISEIPFNLIMDSSVRSGINTDY